VKHIQSFDEFINESEDQNLPLNENNLVYIKDKKFKSSQDIMNFFQKNAGSAFEKFISDKMGVKAKAVTGVSRRGDAVNISTQPISKKDLGIFGFVFSEVSIDSFGGGIIEHQMVNNMQFEFCPAIFFRLHVSYKHIGGGSNGADIVLPSNDPYNTLIMYDIVENRFLDQAEAKASKTKYWVEGSW
jgi:hypothetical protein